MITYGHRDHLYLEKNSPAVKKAHQQGPEGNIDQRPIEGGPPWVLPTCLADNIPIFSEDCVHYERNNMSVLSRRADIQGAKG